MKGMTELAADHLPPHPLAEGRSLHADQPSTVGSLMFDAYLGTLDDHGKAES